MIPCKWLNSSIWPIDETLTSETSPRLESNDNEEVLDIAQTPILEPHHQMV